MTAMRQPSVYEHIEITNRRSEWMEQPDDLDGIRQTAEWVVFKGAQVADIGHEGFRYRNYHPDYPNQEWHWLNIGQWLLFYDGVEFDIPNDAPGRDVDPTQHVGGPMITEPA